MTYAMRLKRVSDMLKDLLNESTNKPELETVWMGRAARGTVIAACDTVLTISEELDETPRTTAPNNHGQPMELVASFPYPHMDDRTRMRVALYDVPNGTETFAYNGIKKTVPAGEYYLCTESREDHHDGFREPTRFWGHYFGYGPNADKESAFQDGMKQLSTKMTNLVSPFRRAD